MTRHGVVRSKARPNDPPPAGGHVTPTTRSSPMGFPRAGDVVRAEIERPSRRRHVLGRA
ncbi:hypothetical protein ACIP98_34465 [Streptomyces sp. NPDC088354]|uniref:hypothetical protein n=1 Tax=Streptomyces sp. NPDC088354 TaxID=3365856 RepID=UPI0037F20D0F